MSWRRPSQSLLEQIIVDRGGIQTESGASSTLSRLICRFGGVAPLTCSFHFGFLISSAILVPSSATERIALVCDDSALQFGPEIITPDFEHTKAGDDFQ